MSSESYWRKREEEALQHYITDEKEYDKRIKEIYQNMLDEAQADIDRFFARYAGKEGITIAEAKKRVSKADIKEFERKAKKYVAQAAKDRLANGGQTDFTAAYFSDKANQEMRLYNLMMKVNRLEMLKANIGLSLIKGHAELEQFMGEILKGRTEAELKRQAGILGKTVRTNAKMADSIVNASFHNATFSDRIWANQAIMKADLSKLIQSGLIQGKGARELAKELQKYYIGEKQLKNGRKGAKYATERLMRTELARVQTDAQAKSYEAMGFNMFTFHANYGCCELCRPLDGKHFKLSELQVGKNAPPMHPSCRCAISPYEDDAEYEAWLDYLDKGGSTEEWKAWKEREQETSKGSLNDIKNKRNFFGRARFRTGDMDSDEYANKKRFESFFGIPQDDTSSWTKHSSDIGGVFDLTEYSTGNEVFHVDGKHILLDYSEDEKKIAQIIARYGKSVQMVPRILFPEKIQTPDYLIDGSKYDLKTPIGNGKNTLYGMVKSKKRQANNFVICLDKTEMTLEDAERQINDIYTSRHTAFVDTIVLVRDGSIKKVYKRKT